MAWRGARSCSRSAKGAERSAALSALGLAEGSPLGPAAAPLDPALAARAETLRVVKALRRRADVESADPNYLRRAYRTPSDPFFRHQWHYPLIRLPQAWDVTTGTPATGEVVVAVVDTGVMLSHPDLSGKVLPGFDFVSDAAMSNDGDGRDANADDPGDALTPGGSSWHGTHVAGTVGAAGDDGAGVAGVSWGARILPVRALGRGGGTSFDIIQAVRWAAGLSNDSGTVPPRRADVINLSLGGPGSSASEQAEYTAVRGAGVIIIAAAGNDSSAQLGFPASYEGVVSVSAVDMALARAPYSNFGTAVDVAAPGGDSSADRDGNGIADGVVSTYVDDASGTRTPAFGQLNGTSMAAPHVAGVAALMKAVCPSLTPAQFDALLTSGALTQDLGAAGRDDFFGHGLIDALSAVQAAGSQCGLAPVPVITVAPGRIDLSSSDAGASFTVSIEGAGQVGVSEFTDDAPWLTVAPAGVDANGIGSYALTVEPDRPRRRALRGAGHPRAHLRLAGGHPRLAAGRRERWRRKRGPHLRPPPRRAVRAGGAGGGGRGGRVRTASASATSQPAPTSSWRGPTPTTTGWSATTARPAGPTRR